MASFNISRLSNFMKYSYFKYNCLRSTSQLTSTKYVQTLLNLPETKITVLPNGFKVATEETNAQTSTVGVWLDAGPRYETEQLRGAANFLEHISSEGSVQMSKESIAREIANMGAQFNSYVEREETAYFARCLPTDVPKVVDIISDVVQNPKLDEETIEKTRKVILGELNEMQDDLKQVTFDYLHLTAYQGTPLARAVYGSVENTEKITATDVALYHRNNVIAPRMVLCGTGNVNHDKLVELAEKRFSSVPYTYTSEIPVIEPCRYTGSDVRDRNDYLPFAHVAIAIDTCGLNNPDLYPLMIAQAHIGRWDKTYGGNLHTCNTLMDNISGAKGCHSYEAFHILYRDSGLWGCYYVLDKMLLDDFMYFLQNEWMKLCVNITEVELALAKNALRNNLLLKLDDPVTACADIAREVLLFDKRTHMSEVEEEIESVTLQSFRDTCMKYIYDRCPVIAAVGPVEALTDYIRVRANMYWIRY